MMDSSSFSSAAAALATTCLADVWIYHDSPQHDGCYLSRRPFRRQLIADLTHDIHDSTSSWQDSNVWDDPDTAVEEPVDTKKMSNDYSVWYISIVYSPIWRVPVLYFRAEDCHGAPLPRQVIVDNWFSSSMEEDQASACSYEEHPVTGVPACFLHPCRTAERMEQLTTGSPSSGRHGAVVWLWSWWTLMAPVVGLDVDPIAYERVRKRLLERDSG